MKNVKLYRHNGHANKHWRLIGVFEESDGLREYDYEVENLKNGGVRLCDMNEKILKTEWSKGLSKIW